MVIRVSQCTDCVSSGAPRTKETLLIFHLIIDLDEWDVITCYRVKFYRELFCKLMDDQRVNQNPQKLGRHR